MTALLLLIRILSIPTAVVGLIMLADLLVAQPKIDTVTLLHKTATRGRAGEYKFQVQGGQTSGGDVQREFYNICQPGDILHVSLTPLFGEWTDITLVRNNIAVARSRGGEIGFMAAIAAGCLLPLIAFLPARRLVTSKVFIITSLVMEFVGFGVGFKLLLYAFGVIRGL